MQPVLISISASIAKFRQLTILTDIIFERLWQIPIHPLPDCFTVLAMGGKTSSALAGDSAGLNQGILSKGRKDFEGICPNWKKINVIVPITLDSPLSP